MTFTNIFDVAVSCVGLFTNLLALEAVVTGKFSLAGYRRFLISLLVSDLCICMVTIMLFALQAFSELEDLHVTSYKCLAEIGRSLEIISLTANLLNLCGMSVDHFIGIVYPLKYKYLSGLAVSRSAVYIIWALSLVIGFADYPVRAMTFAARGQSPVEVTNDIYNNCKSAIEKSTVNYSSPSLIMEASAENEDIRFELFDLNELHEIFNSVLNSSAVDDPCVNKTRLYELQRQHNHAIEEGLVSSSWCAYFDGSYKVWLEIIVMSLSICSLIFLGICYGFVFRAAAGHNDQSKHSLRKLVLTTILLLGTFTVCWVPFVAYEVAMVLVLRLSHKPMSSSTAESFFRIHNILHSMCITCSPLLVPIIYAARIRVVQRRFLERYGFMMPVFFRRCLIKLLGDRRSDQLAPEQWYYNQRSSTYFGSHEELVGRSSGDRRLLKCTHQKKHSHEFGCASTCSRENLAIATRSTSFRDLTCSESIMNVFALNRLPTDTSQQHQKPQRFQFIDE